MGEANRLREKGVQFRPDEVEIQEELAASSLPQKDHIRPDEMALCYDVDVKTVYGWIATGRLAAVKVGGAVRIKRRDAVLFAIPVIQ